MEEEIKKGRVKGVLNSVYYPSGVVRVPIELIEPIELLVKTYKDQRKAWVDKTSEIFEAKYKEKLAQKMNN